MTQVPDYNLIRSSAMGRMSASRGCCCVVKSFFPV